MQVHRQFSLARILAIVAAAAVLCAIAANFGVGSSIVTLFTVCLWAVLLLRWRPERMKRRRALALTILAGVCGAASLVVWAYPAPTRIPGLFVNAGRVLCHGTVGRQQVHCYIHWSRFTQGFRAVVRDGLPDSPNILDSGNDALCVRGFGFYIGWLPWEFSGGDYLVSPFVGVAIPYWFLIGTSLVVVSKLDAARWQIAWPWIVRAAQLARRHRAIHL